MDSIPVYMFTFQTTGVFWWSDLDKHIQQQRIITAISILLYKHRCSVSVCAFPGPVCGDLPLRVKAAPEFSQRAAATAGFHLG